jgi:hypothetical protein
MSSLSAEQRARLLQAKVATLVRDQWGEGDLDLGPFLGGAVARRGAVAWVLAEERGDRSLGAALAWAKRSDVEELHVLAATGAGTVARQAQQFDPQPQVWTVHERTVVPAEADPLPAAGVPDERALAFAPVLAEGGAKPWVEHDGTVVGEVLGLEVARVVDGELEVGVGKHDREAHHELLNQGQWVEDVRRVVETVRALRADDRHPLHRVSLERWLADVVVTHPEWVGAGDLERRPSLVLRDDLRDRAPAPVVGDGVVAVCSVGLDPELVPLAADLRSLYDPAARLVLVVPEGDDHPSMRSLAEMLHVPAEVVTVRKDWRDAAVD